MIKKQLYGETVKEQLLAAAQDKIYHLIMAQNTIRGVVLKGTRMVNEMRWNHDLGILETLVLGHAYLAGGLLSGGLKGNDRISLSIACSGPIKGLSVEANAFGEVRGFLKQVPIPVDKPLESFNLSPFFGAGFLTVTKYLEDAKQPFTGQVDLAYGSMAKDLAHYYLTSEQVPTSIALSIVFDTDGEVEGAGGLLLQALPGADDDVLYHLEQLIKELPSIGKVVQGDDFPDRWIETSFRSLTPRVLGNERVEFKCHCNDAQIRNMLTMLEYDELKDMAVNGPFPINIRCHNCNTEYAYDQKAIEEIFARRSALKG